ncbi:MAG: hypothetical protein P8103_06025 [Candidatus Thiodiazotropha sp.]
MKSVLLPVHLSFVGIWLGCVLTEALFERALLGKSKEHELTLVSLHKRVDLIVEIPAFAVVLITGAQMLPVTSESGLIHVKIALGLIAILVNGYCVWLVFRRAAAAQGDNWEEFSRLDHKQHKYGALVLFTIVAALSVGLYAYGST